MEVIAILEKGLWLLERQTLGISEVLYGSTICEKSFNQMPAENVYRMGERSEVCSYKQRPPNAMMCDKLDGIGAK
jgi:hypothetical protein